jgi:MFS family permease
LIAPVYIAEIAPSNLRGMLVSFNQLNIVLGISASFFSNYFLLGTGVNNWRWMLGVEAIPAALCFILLFFVPESPRWLFGRGRGDRAQKIFARVGGAEHAERELRGLRLAEDKHGARPETTPLLRRLAGLFSRRMSFIMFIALTIAFFQQITGINAIFYYLPTIFAQAGNGLDEAFMQAALVGLVNLSMTLVAMWLIDRLGRKPLLLIGAAGMTGALLTCAWAFHDAHYQLAKPAFTLMEKSQVPAALIAKLEAAQSVSSPNEDEFIAALEKQIAPAELEPHRDAIAHAALNIRASLVMAAIMVFVASFAISLGPVMWVLLSEIFPLEHKGMAISLVGFWNGLVSFLVTLLFPRELSWFGPAGTFLGYGLFALATFVFVLAFIPETKRRTLEELEGDLLRS